MALRAADLLLTSEQVARALAAAGMDEHLAEHWPAAISWAAETDKEGVAWIVPIPALLRTALAEYLRTRGIVGAALLFPAERDAAKPRKKRRTTRHPLSCSRPSAPQRMPAAPRLPRQVRQRPRTIDPVTVRAVMDVGT